MYRRAFLVGCEHYRKGRRQKSAGGMTNIPTFKNVQPLNCSPSRRNAISHRTVALSAVLIRDSNWWRWR